MIKRKEKLCGAVTKVTGMKRKMILTFGKASQAVREKRGESKGVTGTETSPGRGRCDTVPCVCGPPGVGVSHLSQSG